MLLSIPPRASGRPRLIPGLALRAGDPIAGRHRVLSLLRADRACAHFAAIQDDTNTKVEVQILLAMDDSIDDVHLRFLAEARKAAAIRGSSVQRVLQVGVTADGHPFVVREAQRGDVLAALLQKVRSLSTEEAVDVALAVCEALDAAHAQGVVHGALGVSAVHLVWSAGGLTNVKVAGLGTSRALSMLPDDGRSPASLAGRAPELGHGREADARADIWGVGVLLYTMLAGSPPFGASPSTMNVAAALDEPAMLAGVPDGLAEIVDACLALDPAERPRTAAALASRLALYGTRPVFEKRTSLLVVDTGPYDAVVLERLVKEAGPSEASIDVAMDPSVPDVATAVLDRTPMPSSPIPVAPVGPSIPPVAMSVAPPVGSLAAQLAPYPARRRSRATFFVAGACIGFGALVGVLSTRVSSGTAAASLAPPPQIAMTSVPAVAAPPARPANAAVPVTPTLSVGDLPAVAVSSPRARQAPAGDAKTRATSPVSTSTPAAPATAAPSADPAPAVDPIARAAAAPIQPQPKAADDDLRRFLDDRR